MDRLKGIAMISVGSMFWGETGPMMEWMLNNTYMTVEFMLSVRLIIAGIIILFILYKKNIPVWNIWKHTIWTVQLLVFSIVGMLGLQFTFVNTIAVSNATMATLLQFLAPVFIIIYLSIVYKSFPPRAQIIGMLGTSIGLFLLLTNGSFSTLEVSAKTLIWGLTLGLTYAIYTLYPLRLQKEWGVMLIIGWGMIISGTVLALKGQIWSSNEWRLLKEFPIILIILSLVVLGASAFILFLSSMKYISPVETSILSSIEPLIAMCISALWLGSFLKSWQLVGAFILLFFVIFLSIAGEGKKHV